MPVDPKVLVDVDNRQSDHPVAADRLASLLAATLADQHNFAMKPTGDSQLIVAEVGLAFVDIAEMTELNEQHMGGAGPTDVLAFPIDGVDQAHAVPLGQPTMLGDVVICVEVAARAPQLLADELALLVVHGALHLVGHDHAETEETTVMKRLEVDMLQRHYRNGGTV